MCKASSDWENIFFSNYALANDYCPEYTETIAHRGEKGKQPNGRIDRGIEHFAEEENLSA